MLKLLREYNEHKHAKKIHALAQIICIYADAVKIGKGTSDVLFVDAALRHALGKDAPHLHAAMELLIKDGRAQAADIPGCWYIDKPLSTPM